MPTFVLSLRGDASCRGARQQLGEKLKASEKACKKDEKDVAGVEDLRQRLQAAKDALSDKEAKLVQRENDIIARFETQSSRFSSNTTSPFLCPFTFIVVLVLYLY
jgi:hypothetical protein